MVTPDGRTSVLRQPKFLTVFFSQTLTDLCEQVVVVAIIWAVLGRFGGPALGIALMAWALPRGLLLLFGGVVVDRMDRRRLGVGCGLLLAIVTAGAAALAGTGTLAVWIGLAVALGVLDALRLPVAMTLLPLVVVEQDLVDANRWTQLREWGALTLGPALGGFATAALGVRGALLAAAVAYVASSLLLMGLPALPPNREERAPMWRDLADGLRFVTREPRLRIILPAFAVANLFMLGALGVAIPLYVREVLHGGPQQIGLMTACFGVGLVIGTAITGRLPERFAGSLPVVFVLFAGSDLCLALIGLSGQPAFAATAFSVSGVFAGPAATFYRTMLQTIPPDAYRGRVNSIARAASFGLEPLSAALVGAMSSVVSAGTLLVGAGLAATAADTAGLAVGGAYQRRSASPAGPVPVATPEEHVG
jgi:DHA3 family macrolide efflux protein-like MFS transporter